jgi:hypothetical protein
MNAISEANLQSLQFTKTHVGIIKKYSQMLNPLGIQRFNYAHSIMKCNTLMWN